MTRSDGRDGMSDARAIMIWDGDDNALCPDVCGMMRG